MITPEKSEKQKPLEPIDQVIQYLREYPDFFLHNPNALIALNLDHGCGDAVSLIERQVISLREKNSTLHKQLEDLIKIARENDLLNERMHRLTLALMDANTVDEIYVALYDTLRRDFSADAVSLRLFIDPDSVQLKLNPESANELVKTIFLPIADKKLQSFKATLTHERPICGPVQEEYLGYLFGDDSKEIKSTALIPLGANSCTTIDCPYLGILAIGSHDGRCFQANSGTLFLTHLGAIVSRAIYPYIVTKPGYA